MKYPSLFAALVLLTLLSSGCKASKDQYMCRSRQVEAKTNLQGLHGAQTSYLNATKKYASALAETGFLPASTKYYDLSVVSSSPSTYVATATGKNEAAGDVWVVDQTGTPTPKVNLCQRSGQ